ncbi:MAG: hypothetical protein K8M05_36070 [Deltaproteobacteria bacterium]|nr:hypothetical protein [Kofleriaceae bacterium]
MPHPRTADLEALLRALSDAGVPAIVVGGAAAVIHGAPITTQDLDIVPRLEEGDAQRLVAMLTHLDARFRPVLPGRDIVPSTEHFAAQGQLQLVTRHGPLDILCRLHDHRGYAELLPHSREIVDADLRVRVIDLDTLIEIKRSTGRARDQLALPILISLRQRADA